MGSTRRDFLRASATLGSAGAIGALLASSLARAASLQVPEVDKLAVTVVVDSAFDIFQRPGVVQGVRVESGRRLPDFKRTVHNEWGLSMWLESQVADASRTMLLDYGYTPEVLANNLELLALNPAKLNALIVSHGHYDHFGGLIGFLDRYRSVMPQDLKLYAGGEDNFCHRMLPTRTAGQFSDFGTLDRDALKARRITTVLAEEPVVIEGQAFTTGRIRRNSMERVLPQTFVDYGQKVGLGCDPSKYLPAEMIGKLVPDEHIHEHATCFNLKGRGLVVLSSCGHVGMVNTVRQAQAVSGVEKVHAIVGGFHLGPAPADYLRQVVSEVGKLKPDVVIPLHCSGLNFVEEARRQMPDNVLVATTGSRLTFGA